jgi:hypothetical protein
MSQKLKINLLSNNAEFNRLQSRLILKEAGAFSLAVENKDHGKNKALSETYKDVQWCWQLIGKSGKNIFTINNLVTARARQNLAGGLNHLQINFPKFLEGGGLAWLEPFREDDPATGNPGDGIYVEATGKPSVIIAEWKDKDENKIKGKVAFGSTVYLHVYTEALYDEVIEIQLRDTKLINSNLTPTPADKDGQPSQKLDPKALTRFKRRVEVHQYDSKTKPQSTPPSGALTGQLSSTKKPSKDTVLLESNVQKCVFPVFIEHAWQFQGSGNFDSGEELSINPIIYNPKIKNGEQDIDCVLKVSRTEGKLIQGESNGNNPLMVGEAEKSGVPDKKKVIDFTFGIFTDGTGNNMYNSEARQNFEKAHGVANKQSDVEKYKEEKYRYFDNSSYENDLSNPAIIYQNYKDDLKNQTHPVFKVYTEGIGTITKPDEEGKLEAKDYKGDSKIGYGVGVTGGPFGNYGIKKKVRQTCEEMAKNITNFMKYKPDHIVGTITVDVFGFSRGAAAARNFVHEITYPSYNASPGIEKYRCDQHGYPVAHKYFTNTRLPSNGHLGYLLTEESLTFEKLDIRFAGLYDTVPHHGILQSNDAEDLGLHSINKANYVVHLAAGDEHRSNFSLVGINSVARTGADTGKKGGIELFLPGVHCDVGGSYIDEKPENKTRIDAMFDYHKLKKLKEELVTQGWFQNHQLYILGSGNKVDDTNYRSEIIKLLLNSERTAVSNQYSFIPLHLMVEFCLIKGLGVNKEKLKEKYKFTNTKRIPNNVQFLERIKQKLYAYAFDGASKFDYIAPEKFYQPDVIHDPKDTKRVNMEYLQRQIEGQNRLDEIAKQKNTDIMFLRNNHLHWNSVYGQQGSDIATQPHHPNIVDDKRKREIR